MSETPQITVNTKRSDDIPGATNYFIHVNGKFVCAYVSQNGVHDEGGCVVDALLALHEAGAIPNPIKVVDHY